MEKDGHDSVCHLEIVSTGMKQGDWEEMNENQCIPRKEITLSVVVISCSQESWLD